MSALDVCVITPSYQQARWLSDCIESVAAQTLRPDVHLVADGGSTDDSVPLLRSLSYDHLRWWSRPDKGQADALAQAYANTTSEIIAWVNSDDMLADRRSLEWVADCFRRLPDVDVVHGDAIVVDATGRFVQYLRVPAFDIELFRAYNFLVQPAVFVRRRAIEKLSTFVDTTLDYVFDRDLWFRLHDAGARFHRLDRALSVDRHRAGRKVLHEELVAELRRLDEARGATSHESSSWPTRRRRVLNRIEGIAPAVDLDRRTQPVPGLDLASRSWRIYAQMARPWSRAL